MKIGEWQPNENPIVGELRNWYKLDKAYAGVVYGSSIYPTGTSITTDYVKEVLDKLDYFLIKCHNGQQWLAYKDKVHPATVMKGKDNG